MSNRYILLALVLPTMMWAVKTATASEFVVAVSPYNTAAVVKQHAAQILTFALTQNAGDKVIVVDGYNIKPIATITIPDDVKYKSPKSRMNFNRVAVAALYRFSEKVIQSSGGKHPTVKGAVKLPQLLRFVAQNYQTAAPLDVMVLGSALYDDPNQAAFSMAKGYYPSDGHISASRAATPFGTKDVKDVLKRMRVHLGFDDAVLDNDRLSFSIHRFWTLFVERQGGKLVSFSSPQTVFDRVKNKAITPAHSHTLLVTDKLEMIDLRPVQLKLLSIFDRKVSNVPLGQKRINRAEKLELGIAWDCVECDLDIHSQPYPNAPILSYSNKLSPQGHYWKDYLRSPNTVRGFETIAYHVPLDLSAVAVAVNFYSGSSLKSVSGEVRVSVDGQTYASHFTINARKGNGGKGVKTALETRHSTAPETVIIDLLKLVKSGTQR